MMREDQRIRALGIVMAALVYVARLALHGNGAVGMFGYEINSFALTLSAFIVLALPETLDQLPFGPSRTGQ